MCLRSKCHIGEIESPWTKWPPQNLTMQQAYKIGDKNTVGKKQLKKDTRWFLKFSVKQIFSIIEMRRFGNGAKIFALYPPHLSHILLLTFIQLWAHPHTVTVWACQAVSFQALPGFMRQGESLKWPIDRARVLFPSALPESAIQWFTDVAWGRGGWEPQESFLSLKTETKTQTRRKSNKSSGKAHPNGTGRPEKSLRK